MTQPRDKYGRFKKADPSSQKIYFGEDYYLLHEGKWSFEPCKKIIIPPSSVQMGESKHHIAMRALLWATVGFLSGVVFEMFVQLVTR